MENVRLPENLWLVVVLFIACGGVGSVLVYITAMYRRKGRR